MKETITWLHISDTHFCESKNGWDNYDICEKFYDDLKKMNKDHNLHPDLIFFTGDLVYGYISNSPGESLRDQFEEARNFIEKVINLFSPPIPKENVFIVPGNHDVNRKQVTDEQIFFLDKLNENENDPSSYINKMIQGKGTQWKRYMERLEEFKNFLKDSNFGHLIEDPERLIYSHIREINGFKIGIAGLNSAWSSSRPSNQEKSKLWLGNYQVSNTHNKLRDVNFSIALIHHPLNWFTSLEDPRVEHEIESSFDFCLHGHEHSQWVEEINNHVRIAAGAFYNGSERENIYNFIRINPFQRRGEVFLRKYDVSGRGWVPRPVHKKADDGIWKLKLDWINFSKNDSKIEVEENIESEIIELDPYGSINTNPFNTFLIPKNEAVYPLSIQKNTSSILYINNFFITNGIRDSPIETCDSNDIKFKEINLEDINEIPIREKTPFLHELKKQEQISKHFILLPRVEKKLNELLSNKRDLLFLGLPFCGKTSLLTYLAYESVKKESLNIQPIWLEVPEELPYEEVHSSVGRLIQALRQQGFFKKNKRVTLIIDNIHKLNNFTVAKELLNQSGRSWLVWGAARPGELSGLLKNEENPWDEKYITKDICDLLNKKDIEYIFQQLIKPELINKNLDSDEISEIHEIIVSRKSVPIRFMIKILHLFHSTTIPPVEGYVPLIEKEPTKTEDVVRSLWPLDRVGIETISIACYLPRPSWDILEKIVEYMNKESREKILRVLRSSLALLDDSDEPLRATMYDPVREQIEEGNYVTEDLKEKIWRAIEHVLSTSDYKTYNHEGLYQMWIDFGRLAKKENKFEIGMKLFEIAISQSNKSEKIDSLSEYADCLVSSSNPDWDNAIKAYQEALSLLDREGQKEGRTAVLLGLAFCLHRKPEPEWDNAIKAYQEILNLLDKEGQKEGRTAVLLGLAFCLHRKPEPEWDNAIKAYQEALSLLDKEEQKEERATVLQVLAFCFNSKPEPEWDNAIKAYQEALNLLDKEQNGKRATVLQVLAFCFNSKPEHEWDNAIKAYQEALSLLDKEEQKEERANVLQGIAYCLRNKPEPEWDNAIKAYQEALSLLDKEQKGKRTNVLSWLAFCFNSKPEPEWDNAIKAYQEALSLLDKEEQKEERANVLQGLAFCLHRKPEPEWDNAIKVYQEILNLLDKEGQKEGRTAVLLGLAFSLHRKPEPEWDNAIKAYQEALSLLDKEEQKEERATVLQVLAFCFNSKPEPEWDNAIKAYQEALSLLDKEEQKERANVLSRLAFCLHRKPNPDWISSIKNFKKSVKIERISGTILGLIICYDAIGEFEEADKWSRKLQNPSFKVRLYKDTVEVKVLQDAYLCLRSGNIEKAIQLAGSLKESSENSRAMLISSIAYYERGNETEFLKCLSDSSASFTDKLWAKSVAIGFFKRFNISGIEKFLQALMEEPEKIKVAS